MAEYTPHEGQVAFHESKARFKGAACGRRFGKSRMGSMDKLDKLFIPSFRCIWWIVSDSYATGEEEFTYVEDAIDKICRSLKVKVTSHSHNLRTGEMWIVMPWKARIQVKSAQHPKALVGKGLGCLTMAEAAKMDRYIWDLVSPGLADFRAPVDFLSTPEGDNWFKEIIDFGKPELENGEPNPRYIGNEPKWEESYESFNMPSWENSIIYPGGFNDPEIQRQMKTPKGTPFFWQDIGARFGAMIGRIYGDFTRTKHIRSEPYDQELPNYEWFDWGFSNPWVCLDVQAHKCACGALRYHIWREYYERERTGSQNVLELRARVDPHGFKIDCGFGDSASPGDVEEVSKYRCAVQALDEAKDWRRGVQEIQEKLNPRGCKEPHLTIDPSCLNTISEFVNYRWPRQTMDAGEEDTRETSSKPAKQDDHSMDAIRYGLMHLEVLGGKYHLSEVYSPAPKRTREGELVGVRGESETMFSLKRDTEF